MNTALITDPTWIFSIVLGIGLHIVFSGLLGVNLPRGTVSFLRDFSLTLENLF